MDVIADMSSCVPEYSFRDLFLIGGCTVKSPMLANCLSNLCIHQQSYSDSYLILKHPRTQEIWQAKGTL